MSDAPLLDAEAAAFRYAGAARPVGPFDLRAAAGELHLIGGPSGGGKSTLARLLAGVIPHLYRGDVRGNVRVAGRPTPALPLWQLAERVGLVAQNPAAQLLASTVRDEIAFGLESLGLAPGEVAARSARALESLALAPLADRDPRTLSGGEQQRLVIAALAARTPDALVLDEPLSMLDAEAAPAVVAQLDALRRTGTAVVVCEHRLAAFAGLREVHRHTLPGPGAAPDAALPPLAGPAPFRLALEGLCVERGGRPVLRGVDLTLAGGEVVAVVGANGAGKTTLLRALAGMQPHAGRRTVVASAAGPPPRLGLAFQNPDCQLFNASVAAELRCGDGAAAPAAQLDAVLALLGLADYADTPPLLLSEGEKKRLGLGILLLQRGLGGVCLDEPTLGQDAAHRRLLGRVVRHLARAGWLCVVATHDRAWAAEWCDRVVTLADGRVAALARGSGAADAEVARA